MGRKKRGGPDGVLVVDKPRGPTSHDVVRDVRRAYKTRAVGHAGTLDPMATGVLVIALGRATKLVPWLTAADKRYAATLQLGQATDTLDAEGEVVDEAAVPPLTPDVVRVAAEGFLGEHDQRAPAVSAIRVDGVRLHERVRRGEDVEAPVRRVTLREISIDAVRDDAIELTLEATKGFYVRSFARDLAAALGTVGHLTALRRVASGPFRVDEACTTDQLGSAPLASLADAASRTLAVLRGTEASTQHARHGQAIPADTVQGVQGEGPFALLDPAGELVAVVRTDEAGFRVVRGFPPATPP